MPAWNTQSEFQLLLIIINQAEVKNIKWAEVPKVMGPDYTIEAVKQKFRKIKAASTDTPKDVPEHTDAHSAAPRTPVSRKRKGSSKKKDMDGSGDAEDNDEQIDDTPIKKQKKELKAEED